ncbi:MAG: membrane protein insertion efficiency factor YidD [Terriglobales bacterium]
MNQIHKTIVLFVLRAYKWAVSPMLLPACRYVPSCSEYAMEAIDRYGVARGSVMAVWRVMRCHPFAKGGLDPVIKLEVNKPTDCGVPVQSGSETELCSH